MITWRSFFGLFLCAVGVHSLATVSNPSFEVSDTREEIPQGWRFQGPEDAKGKAWSSEDPYDGSRCLRIAAEWRTQSWESDLFPIEPEKDYLLHWMTKFWGQKAWRFRSEFCGIEVICLDRAGQTLETHSQHTHCWQTLGWRPAWLRFASPPGAKSMKIRFSVRTEESLPGGFDIDTIELLPAQLKTSFQPGKVLLTIRTIDESGVPSGARLRLVKADPSESPEDKQDVRNVILPRASVVYAMDAYSFHTLEPGLCQVEVPPGRYDLTVTKGFEHRPIHRVIEVGTSDVRIEVPLERSLDWGKRGWYCGDHHVHLYRHGGSMFPSLTYRDVLRFAQYEDLDFLPFMGADKYPSHTEQPRTEQEKLPLYELTHEITEDFWGHVCPIGVAPDCRETQGYDEGPMNFDRYKSFAEEGGALAYAHPYGIFPPANEDLDPLADPRSGLVSREFPIDLALGMPCSIDLLAMEGDANRLNRKLRDLYRLYNLGFRFGLTGSTDFHVEQGRQPLGSVRTYVHPDKFTLASIAQCYREGRTFCTNGPLIEMTVNGARPGGEIRIETSPAAVDVRLEVASIGGLHEAEIIMNGQAVKTLRETEPGWIRGDCKIELDKSSWIALRVYGPEDPNLAASLEGRPLGAGQFAHTSPVYVILNDQPIQASSEAGYFIDWCDAALEAWEGNLPHFPEQRGHDDLVRTRIKQARSVFEDMGHF
jgi:hypothetical protein